MNMMAHTALAANADPHARWRALEKSSGGHSASASPPWLLAAMDELPEGERPRPLALSSPTGGLAAMAGVRVSRRLWPLAKITTTRWGEFFFSGQPLVARGREEEALRGLLERARQMGAPALELAAIDADGPLLAAARRLAGKGRLRLAVMDEWQRAALEATRGPGQWWQEDISRRRRKEWNRLARRLAEKGEVTFEALAPGDDHGEWLAAFLELEKSGWKGKAGTAIACNEAHRRFVEKALAAFAAGGRLRFWRLRLDGETIATLFGFLTGDRLWLGKMAYDERWAEWSPGVLMMLEATRDILADGRIALADSCADPGHPMIERIWKQRIGLADVLILPMDIPSPRAEAIIAAERTRRKARSRLKQLWHAVRR